MIAKLPLVPFEIINLTRLTVGVCMKVRFKSKVTRGFSLSHRLATRLRRFAAISRLKKNLWDQGTDLLAFNHFATLVPEVFLEPRDSREAPKTSSEAVRKRKTSGYLGLESHFHADANCQTRQIDNFKRD